MLHHYEATTNIPEAIVPVQARVSLVLCRYCCGTDCAASPTPAPSGELGPSRIGTRAQHGYTLMFLYLRESNLEQSAAGRKNWWGSAALCRPYTKSLYIHSIADLPQGMRSRRHQIVYVFCVVRSLFFTYYSRTGVFTLFCNCVPVLRWRQLRSIACCRGDEACRPKCRRWTTCPAAFFSQRCPCFTSSTPRRSSCEGLFSVGEEVQKQSQTQCLCPCRDAGVPVPIRGENVHTAAAT